MKIKKLLKDRIIVQDDSAEVKTASGLFMPEDTSSRTINATVIEVGTGTTTEPITVNKGDRIIYDKISGFTIKLDGINYKLLNMADVIATIE